MREMKTIQVVTMLVAILAAIWSGATMYKVYAIDRSLQGTYISVVRPCVNTPGGQ